MKITKRQLKRIIREEYSRLRRRGLIREAISSTMVPADEYFGDNAPVGAINDLIEQGVKVYHEGNEVYSVQSFSGIGYIFYKADSNSPAASFEMRGGIDMKTLKTFMIENPRG